MQLAQSAFVQYSLKVLEEMEGDIFFSIACNKDQIFQAKRELLQHKDSFKINVIANHTNFGCISGEISGRKINRISPEMLKSVEKFGDLIQQFENSLVITTSNIFAEIGANIFGKLYEYSPSTIFSVHDYDNHHWINNNIQVAIFSDVYIPAHQDENLLASRINPNILGGIPCGSNQWSAKFIQDFGCNHLLHKRSLLPLGRYFFYEKFMHRNKLINTLSQSYPEIGFVKQDFHTLSQEDKWREWSSHALHWIAPVLNDLPIRFFDALITGGIPLIPSGLKPFVESLQIPEAFYATYSPLDILDPKPLLERQGQIFQNLGNKGVLDRHEYALEHFHIDVLIDKIINKSLNLYSSK